VHMAGLWVRRESQRYSVGAYEDSHREYCFPVCTGPPPPPPFSLFKLPSSLKGLAIASAGRCD
jgi:hypothetical protein